MLFVLQIQVTNNETSHRYGIIAVEDIKCNETLAEIPRNIAFTPSQSSIASRLQGFKEKNIDRSERFYFFGFFLIFYLTCPLE